MKKLLSLVSLIGILLTLAEAALQLSHSNLCNTQGCLLIAQSVRYSDELIVISGFLVFLAIFVLNRIKTDTASFLINQLLIAALSAEGVFVGYQLFRMRHICLFCLIVFSIFVVLALIRIIQKHFSVVAGFLSFFAILILFFLLKPIYNTPSPLLNKPLVLIYKQSCPHCEKVIQEAKENNINVCTIKAHSCFDLLKSLDINRVPLLIISKKDEKKIIVGEQNILQYLINKKNIHRNNLYNTFFKDKKGFCTIGKECK